MNLFLAHTLVFVGSIWKNKRRSVKSFFPWYFLQYFVCGVTRRHQIILQKIPKETSLILTPNPLGFLWYYLQYFWWRFFYIRWPEISHQNIATTNSWQNEPKSGLFLISLGLSVATEVVLTAMLQGPAGPSVWKPISESGGNVIPAHQAFLTLRLGIHHSNFIIRLAGIFMTLMSGIILIGACTLLFMPVMHTCPSSHSTVNVSYNY
jgi:hypothetical protein